MGGAFGLIGVGIVQGGMLRLLRSFVISEGLVIKLTIRIGALHLGQTSGSSSGDKF